MSKILFLGDYAPEKERLLSSNFDNIIKNVQCVVLNYEGTSTHANIKKKYAKGYAPIINNSLLIKLVDRGVSVVCCLTNNHSKDFGLSGYVSTVQCLLEIGCKVVGPSEQGVDISHNISLNISGSVVNIWTAADFNVGEVGTFLVGSKNYRLIHAYENIKHTLNKSNQINIIFYHAGVEFAKTPNPSLVKNIKKISKLGVEYCFVHHQHVSLPVVYREKTLVAYGLGNFAFDCDSHKRFIGTNKGTAVLLDFNAGISVYTLIDNGVDIDIHKDFEQLEIKLDNYSSSFFDKRWSKVAFNRLFNRDINLNHSNMRNSNRSIQSNNLFFTYRDRLYKVVSMLRCSSGRDVLCGSLYYAIRLLKSHRK